MSYSMGWNRREAIFSFSSKHDTCPNQSRSTDTSRKRKPAINLSARAPPVPSTVQFHLSYTKQLCKFPRRIRGTCQGEKLRRSLWWQQVGHVQAEFIPDGSGAKKFYSNPHVTCGRRRGLSTALTLPSWNADGCIVGFEMMCKLKWDRMSVVDQLSAAKRGRWITQRGWGKNAFLSLGYLKRIRS